MMVGLFLTSRDRLFTFYNYAILLMDMSLILYLNVLNSVEFFNRVEEKGIRGLELIDVIPLLPIIFFAWVFHIVSIFSYSMVLRSVKPIVFSVVSIPVIVRFLYTPSWKQYPSMWLCGCFAISVYLAMEGMYSWLSRIVYDVLNSCRIMQWMYRMYGFTILIVFHWRRLEVPSCLVIMFSLLFSYNTFVICVFSSQPLGLYQLFHFCIAQTCNSALTMLACCFVIQKICGLMLQIVRYCFCGSNAMPNDDNGTSPNGMREGFGFFFLCLYTGLSSCSPSRKLILLQVIFYLIISAVLRSLFEVVEPVLLALPSQHGSTLKRHLSTLGFCISLLGMSVYLAVSVYSLKERIPFITPNIITIAQILAALALYTLYRYEAQQTDLWEELDDYVYYVNGSCRLFEFVIICAVLCYRVCDFSLEWTVFQSLMALLHIYFNIWTPAKEGWQSLKLRHQVNQKLNSLPMATQDEIDILQDVCAICLDELKVAKVTPCKHYFHSLCLRKWLNIQSKCPMCHSSIIPM